MILAQYLEAKSISELQISVIHLQASNIFKEMTGMMRWENKTN